MFAQLDQPALLPLPAQRYELARFKTVKVHIDYHVEVERHRYSAATRAGRPSAEGARDKSFLYADRSTC